MDKVLVYRNKNKCTFYYHKIKLPDNMFPVTVTLTVRAGSLFDPDGYSGLAHFTEHMNMLFKKEWEQGEQKKFNTYAYTKYFETNYVINCEKENILTALHFINNIIEGKYLLEDQIEAVREEVEAEWHQRNEPTRNVMNHVLFGGSIFENKIPIGELGVIQKIAIDDIRLFFRNYYIQEQMAVQITGNVDNDFAEESFGECQLCQAKKIKTEYLQQSLYKDEKSNTANRIYEVEQNVVKSCFLKRVYKIDLNDFLSEAKDYLYIKLMLDMTCDILNYSLVKYLKKHENSVVCNVQLLGYSVYCITMHVDCETDSEIQKTLRKTDDLSEIISSWLMENYNWLIRQYWNYMHHAETENLQTTLDRIIINFVFGIPCITFMQEKEKMREILSDLTEKKLYENIMEILNKSTEKCVYTKERKKEKDDRQTGN